MLVPSSEKEFLLHTLLHANTSSDRDSIKYFSYYKHLELFAVERLFDLELKTCYPNPTNFKPLFNSNSGSATHSIFSGSEPRPQMLSMFESHAASLLQIEKLRSEYKLTAPNKTMDYDTKNMSNPPYKLCKI